MKIKAVSKKHVSVAVLVDRDAWRDNNKEARDLAIDSALDHFEDLGTLLPNSMKVTAFEPGEWDNTTAELNIPSNDNALLVFNGEVLRRG